MAAMAVRVATVASLVATVVMYRVYMDALYMDRAVLVDREAMDRAVSARVVTAVAMVEVMATTREVVVEYTMVRSHPTPANNSVMYKEFNYGSQIFRKKLL